MERLCKTCACWVPAEDGEAPLAGHCTRHAPGPLAGPTPGHDQPTWARWPLTPHDGRCHEWQPPPQQHKRGAHEELLRELLHACREHLSGKFTNADFEAAVKLAERNA